VTAPPHQPDKRQPRVVRMLNSAAYQLPEVRRLFLASNSRTQDPQFRSAHLAASCQDPRVGNFIGLEAGEPKAMAAIELPFGDIRLCVPTVAVTTNLGSRELGNVTWDAAVAWARSMGVRRLYAANTSGVSDKVYERHFRRHGVRLLRAAVPPAERHATVRSRARSERRNKPRGRANQRAKLRATIRRGGVKFEPPRGHQIAPLACRASSASMASSTTFGITTGRSVPLAVPRS
jgi:N-acetylglutamate synthase-like GNAT family acetyltransferase